MAKKKEIDNETLLKMIEEGEVQTKIMEVFKFKNSTQLKIAYVNALMESDKVSKILGRPKSEKPVDTKVSVNSRGSLIIPKALVDDLGIKEGQIFEVKKSGTGIRMNKVEGEKDEVKDENIKSEKKEVKVKKDSKSGK